MAIFEAAPPYSILERAAMALTPSAKDPKHVPTTRPGKLQSSDWALAVALAGQMNPLGLCAFWARWAGDASSRVDLAAKLAATTDGVNPEYAPALSALAVRSYCDGETSQREICRQLGVSRSQTWPKLQGAYRRMLESLYMAEAQMARSIKLTMY